MARTGSETEQGPGRSLISAAAALALTVGASTVAAAEDASDLPSTWHVHDAREAGGSDAARAWRLLAPSRSVS